MRTLTPADFTKAITQQNQLTDNKWLLRGDELAEQQRAQFMELDDRQATFQQIKFLLL